MNTICAVPQVAVITRTKDRPILLRRAIESVLRQSFGEWVHVIINDGGNPSTVDFLVAEYAGRYQGRVKVIHNPESMGMQNASNRAIQESQSEYLVIHDDDDSWGAEFLEKSVARLNGEDVDSSVQGVTTHVVWVTEEINADGVIVELSRSDFFPKEAITLFEMAAENVFPPIAFLYRRSVHQVVGYFDEQFTVLGDWDFNLRFLSRFDIDVIKEPLALYHWRHRGGDSAYGNTVTAGLSTHSYRRSKLFNHYLRRDIESGKSGLGFLMNVARPMHELSLRLSTAMAVQDQTGRKVNSTLNHAEHLNRITKDLARFWQLKDSIAWGLAVFRNRLSGRAPVKPVSAGECVRSRLQGFVSGMSGDSVLSLDVFDTALLRLVKRPVDVFSFMEPEVERLLASKNTCFAQARIAAEKMARQHFAKDGNAEVTLAQIYGMLGQLPGFPGGSLAPILDLEIATEKALCYANPMILSVYRDALQRGLRVVFISDMYLPDGVIREMLCANGFDRGDLFVSASRGHTKHTGTLFQLVLETLGCKADSMFHIGDNVHSDLKQPQLLGAHALHVAVSDWTTGAYIEQHVTLSGSGGTEGVSSLCAGLARRQSVSPIREGGEVDGLSLWDKIGYEIAGPLMYSFVYWISQRAEAHGSEKLFFLSRDGYYLEQAFRKCAQKWGTGRSSVYMYSSRRLLNLARISQLDEPSLEFLLSSNPDLMIRDFGARIGLDCDLYSDAVNHAGLSLDEVVTTHHGCYTTPEAKARLRALLKGLESPILKLASEERHKLLDYFHDVGFGSGPIAIVDLGWQASSIRSLQDLMNGNGGDSRLRGYYFGTWKFAQPALDHGCLIESFFFHLDKPGSRSLLIAECTEMIEHFFTAPHPTVVSLKKEGNHWAPVYGGWETTESQRLRIARMSVAALQFVDDMLEVQPTLGDRPPPFAYLESVLERILRFPTLEEAVALGDLPHRDSFGGTAPWRYLAKPPSSWRRVFNPQSLQTGYDFAYWKKGFLAQLGAVEENRIRR